MFRRVGVVAALAVVVGAIASYTYTVWVLAQALTALLVAVL